MTPIEDANQPKRLRKHLFIDLPALRLYVDDLEWIEKHFASAGSLQIKSEDFEYTSVAQLLKTETAVSELVFDWGSNDLTLRMRKLGSYISVYDGSRTEHRRLALEAEQWLNKKRRFTLITALWLIGSVFFLPFWLSSTQLSIHNWSFWLGIAILLYPYWLFRELRKPQGGARFDLISRREELNTFWTRNGDKLLFEVAKWALVTALAAIAVRFVASIGFDNPTAQSTTAPATGPNQ